MLEGEGRGKGIPCSERRERQEKKAFHTEGTCETTELMEKLWLFPDQNRLEKYTHEVKQCKRIKRSITYMAKNY